MNAPGRFAGMSVVVTGGAGGIGSAIVRAFAAAGARVIVADIDVDAASRVAGSVGPACSAARLDVSDEPSWESLLDHVESECAGLDVLVNNAGFFRPNVAFEEMPLALWRRHFAVNSDGTFLGCKHAIRRMKPRQRGAIVNIGSGMSLRPQPAASAYCGSKAAVLMTTRSAAEAAGRYGIRVNAVLPGAVSTAMLMQNIVAGQSREAYLEGIAQFGALGRLATTDDVARAVLFLADPANGAITGIFVPVDGGNL
jgi:NAD(P)-dependent dehydrogenase (short-subunit alcohol dehydrogenase family)